MRISWSILLWSLVWALSAGTAGCNSDAGKSVETVTREPVVVPVRDEDAGAVESVPEVEYSVEERARYRRHLHLGRAHGKERRYADAVREFERALEVIPRDPRTLSEIGWAAYQAGDYERARAANQDALRLARDAKVRAASLYNLGRLAETMGQLAEAEEHYRASLALRDNQTVRKRLDGLRAAPEEPAGASAAMCGPFASEDELCACVLASHERGAGGTCQREPRGIAGVELLFAGDDNEEWVHLVHQSERGWSSIATLGQVRDDPDLALHRELEIARFEMRTIGARDVLWVETDATQSETGDHGGKVVRKVRSLVLCPRMADPDRLECKLEIPLTRDVERVAAPAPVGTDNARAARHTRRKPSREDEDAACHLEVDVGDDGTVRVILASGQRDEVVAPLLGVHQLW